jgi:hypothetical protein
MKAVLEFFYPKWKEIVEKKLEKFDFSEIKLLVKEFKLCIKLFWNFGKMGDKIFTNIDTAKGLVDLIGRLVKTVR